MPAPLPRHVCFGPFEIDLETGELRKYGIKIKLQEQPFRVLAILLASAGEVVQREQLRARLWPADTFVDFETGLNAVVRRLRDALTDSAADPRYIETLPRKGYRFIARVSAKPPETLKILSIQPDVFENGIPGCEFTENQGPNDTDHQSLHSADAETMPIVSIIPPSAAENTRIHSSMIASPTIMPDGIGALSESTEKSSGATSLQLLYRRLAARKLIPRWGSSFFWVLQLFGIVLIGLLFAGLHLLRPASPLTERGFLVLSDFVNNTGEPVFDGTLKEALEITLEQSPFLNVLPDSKVIQTLKLMRLNVDDQINGNVAQEICIRTSSTAFIVGSISRLGSQYILQLRAINCRSGDALAILQGEANDRGQVLHVLGEVATKLRFKLGESLVSVQKHDKLTEEVTTSSLRALQAYSEGQRVRQWRGEALAIPFFNRALELDANFASAYFSLGTSEYDLGNTSFAIKNIGRSFELQNHLSEPERYRISSGYYSLVTGEVPKAIEQLELATNEYPTDASFHQLLGNNYSLLGKWQEGAREWQAALRLRPDSVASYNNLCQAYLALNELKEAERLCSDGISRGLDAAILHQLLYLLDFLKHDNAALMQEIQWAQGKPNTETALLSLQSETEAYYGHLNRAREVSNIAITHALREGSVETAARLRVGEALREVAFGDFPRARNAARRALALSQSRDVRIQAALAYAQTRDIDITEKLIDIINKEYRLDTLVQHYWLPIIHAQIELNIGNARKALEYLDVAKSYEFTYSNLPMLAAYIRGKAYLVVGNGDAAAKEFNAILEHRGLVANSVFGPLAQLNFGRALALQTQSILYPAGGTKGRAHAEYDKFLALWRDADPGNPILKQAYNEYSRLFPDDRAKPVLMR